MTKINAKTATLTVSCSQALLDRLDAAAQRTHQSRSAYVLSWLPEAQDLDLTDHRNGATPHNARRARVAERA